MAKTKIQGPLEFSFVETTNYFIRMKNFMIRMMVGLLIKAKQSHFRTTVTSLSSEDIRETVHGFIVVTTMVVGYKTMIDLLQLTTIMRYIKDLASHFRPTETPPSSVHLMTILGSEQLG